MILGLLLIAGLTLASAAVALSLRNLIHSALLLTASWAGLAGFYLWAGAEFLAFAQVLVYVGAVSMIVLFAVLLTRRSRADLAPEPASLGRAATGLFTGLLVAGVLFGAVLSSRFPTPADRPPDLTVHDLGLALMGPHAAALLVLGVILTVALIGAVVIAASGQKGDAP